MGQTPDRRVVRLGVASALAIGAAIIVPAPGHGQSPAPGASPWTSIEVAQVRLIAALDRVGSDGELDVGLQVRLDPGWHTYWRAAGRVGFPPQMDWNGSENLAHLEVMWPSPRRIFAFGYEAVGYENEVVFPMRATLARPGAPLSLRLDAMIAVCRDICIPFALTLALDVSSGPGSRTLYARLIERFRARVPTRGDLSGFTIESVRLVRLGPTLAIEIGARADPPFDAPDIFVETRPGIVVGAREARSTGGGRYAVTVVLDRGASHPRDEEPLTVTLVDGTRAIEREFVATSAP
jgi:suppressor for copper-sensitivity B